MRTELRKFELMRAETGLLWTVEAFGTWKGRGQWKRGCRARMGVQPSSKLARVKWAAHYFFISYPLTLYPSEEFANYAQIRSHITYASCNAACPIIPKHNSVPTNHSPLRA
jgi:hypothetical protein